MQYWSITDPGCVRPENQDTCAVRELPGGGVAALVCDGMGGARSGQLASALAAETFLQSLEEWWKPELSREETDDVLASAIKLANFTVYDRARQEEDHAGMGTTLVAALFFGSQVTVVNVGDSRAYYINSSDIRAITTDHSLVQLMLARGELTPEEARDYPGKNLITRAIGTEPAVQCDIFHLDLERGDSVLLCSDGLTNALDEQEILFEVVHGEQRQDCCQRLLDIAKNRGAPDNVTCVLAEL